MRGLRSVCATGRSSYRKSGPMFCSLDSHADTCCAGENCVLLEDTGKVVRVSAYANTYKPMPNVPIVTAATTYDDPNSGQSYLLVMHQALWFGRKLDTSLICPNQLRDNGIRVDDTPRQFSQQSIHGMIAQTEDGDRVEIPFTLHGVISQFETRLPTQDEIDDGIKRIVLTNEATWKPYSVRYSNAEELHVRSRQTFGLSTEKACDHHGSKSVDHEYALSYAESQIRRHVSAMTSLVTFTESSEGVDENGEPITLDAYGDEIDTNDTTLDKLLNSVDAIYEASVDDKTFIGNRVAYAIHSRKREHRIRPDTLARRWNIGLKTAADTLQSTTQEGVVNVILPGDRRVTRRLNFLRYPRVRLKLFMDTMFAKIKSIRQNAAAQIFTDGQGFDWFSPMKSKGGVHIASALDRLVRNIGIPETIVSDGAKEQVLGETAAKMNYYRINHQLTEPYAPWQDRAERSVREIKKKIRSCMRRTNAPKRLWCFCGDWNAAIGRLTSRESLDGRTPTERVLGTTPDVSLYIMFDWYQVVWYHEPTNEFPNQKRVLGRWLGVAHDYHEEGVFWILTEKGTYVARKSVWSPSEEEKNSSIHRGLVDKLDESIARKLGDSLADADMDKELLDSYEAPPPDLFESEPDAVDEPEDERLTAVEADDHTPEEMDEYLTAQVLVNRGDQKIRGTVVRRLRDVDNIPVGKRNANPILDTRVYEVQFPDGSSDSYAANTLAENLYSQIDDEGRTQIILKEIVDHRSNGRAVKKDDGYLTDSRGRRFRRRTTVGWELQVLWRDETTSWIPLKELKESNPIEVAEYAVGNKIAEEPAFVWWVPHVLKKRDRMIKKVKSKYWLKTHKFGIELPKTVEEALEIDRRTGTDYWRKAIEKEMKNVRVAFKILDGDGDIPIGHLEIKCHMVFDVKMDLTRKARLVAGGHKTEPSKESVYSSVVSRDSVRLAFLIAALNDLDVMSADIQNAYLNAPTKEALWCRCGLEFGPDAGKPAKIVRALYGLRSSGKSFRDHVSQTLREAGFKSCLADPDVYMRKAVKPNGAKYWEYVLMYVDDIMVVSHNTKPILDHFEKTYTLKAGSIKEPDSYLGADIKKFHLEGDGNYAKVRWAMSSDTYIKRAVAEVERNLEEVGQKLSTKVETPLSSGYRPELDMSRELDARKLNYYQGLIGVLRWICELGRVDILFATSVMSSYLASPREGHLEQVLHIFAYLRKYDRSSLVFNDIEPEFDDDQFRDADWKDMYPDAQEPIPPNAPEARGMHVNTTCFVDADHAGCRMTRRSHTGFIIFVNKAPIMWWSKRQNTVESSTFGSEYVALGQATDAIEGLRYKLRMMGVGVDGPTNVFCDIESVVKNSSTPESTLEGFA